MEPESSTLLMAAMHTHLQAVSKRPLTPAMLVELEHTTLLARKLFAIAQDPSSLDKRSLLHSQPYGGNVVGDPIGYAAYPAPMNTSETFGVQAIKELVSLLPNLFPKPLELPEPPAAPLNYADLAAAMVTAREAKDDALYSQLMSRLEADQKRAELTNQKLAPESSTPEGQAA